MVSHRKNNVVHFYCTRGPPGPRSKPQVGCFHERENYFQVRYLRKKLNNFYRVPYSHSSIPRAK